MALEYCWFPWFASGDQHGTIGTIGTSRSSMIFIVILTHDSPKVIEIGCSFLDRFSIIIDLPSPPRPRKNHGISSLGWVLAIFSCSLHDQENTHMFLIMPWFMTRFWVELFRNQAGLPTFSTTTRYCSRNPHDAHGTWNPPADRPRLCPPMTQRSAGWQRPSHLTTNTRVMQGLGRQILDTVGYLIFRNEREWFSCKYQILTYQLTSNYWEWQESLVGLGIGRRGYCTMAFMGAPKALNGLHPRINHVLHWVFHVPSPKRNREHRRT